MSHPLNTFLSSGATGTASVVASMVEPHAEQVTAEVDGDFVVFRIGMRINAVWKVHRWLPVFLSMPRMLHDLEDEPERGLMAYDLKLGLRSHEVVQYWRSFEHLRGYALDPEERHAASMQRFVRAVRESEDVGLWHETYLVRAGEYETIYTNMPPTGLGKAGDVRPAAGRRATAAGRLGLTKGDDMAYDEDGVRRKPLHAEP